MGRPPTQAFGVLFHVKHALNHGKTTWATSRWDAATGPIQADFQFGSGRIHTMHRSTSSPGTVNGST